MSIDMYVGSSQAQASGVNTMCQKQIQGYQQLQQAINQFVMSSAELQGKTYDSAKQYFSAVLNPLAKGGMLLAEATAKACQKFPDDYQSQVDSADLKSSELEEQIQQYQQGIDTANSIIQFVSSSPLPEPAKKTVLKSVKDVKEGQEKAKKKLDKKLKKLLKFDSSSPSIFSEIATLESAVNAGTAQAGTCWNGSTGTFMVPKQEDMAWATHINLQWEKRAMEKGDGPKVEVKQRAIGKGTQGETYIYEVYVDGIYDAEQSKRYNEIVQAANLSALHFMGDLTLINDIYRLVTGKDWLSGEKESRLEAGFWLALSVIPVEKLLRMAKEIKAGNKLLKGVALTEKEISILTKAGYFDEVKRVKFDFGAENPVSGKEWNEYFKVKYGSGNVQWQTSVKSINEIIDTPSSLTGVNPIDVVDFVKKKGWNVTPLKKGENAGIPFEKGGGFSMNPPAGTSGSSRYIQYHPGGGHHGDLPYYKVSSPENGISRIYIDGRVVKE
ncbi:T7SS effector LXG polymorphic toxin [Enterococcus malodoratus]|uniref:LXG domain-containing protein n=2 Tax=Enterococcus malodoratus TaxID=71451 RepID=R2RI44_9ENTE|nr:T7SS effector LXG polymorphic toxin [Enterococcus malodoratus]EOH75674.1 hypothetical protein UAI_02683 [Enterococcus malodoratus ATCC 43197]EOT67501.1 hypothetical protein I585_03022 [Enterococcus malodoratus ATCC 43197]SPX03477.1 Bacillus transposase protein [Enterococcus malodoratus]STD69247.1 Bacillus transposase protein [Enterococcus malodoratus]